MRRKINAFLWCLPLPGLLAGGCLDTPNRELIAIAVSAPPSQNAILYEPVNLEGMVVTGTYTDGSQETLSYTPEDVAGYDPERLGEQRLRVTIQGKSAEFSITVEKVLIRVLNYPTGDGDEGAALWAPFQAAHPGIQLEREDVSGAAYDAQIAGYMSRDELPDVVYAWPGGRSAKLHEGFFLKDLSPFIQRDGLFSSFYGILYPGAQRAGYRAVIPLGFQVRNLFYINKYALWYCGYTPAATGAYLQNQANAIRSQGVEVLKLSGASAAESCAALFALIAGRFNGPGWGSRLYTGESRFSDPDFVKALRYIKTLYASGALSSASFNAASIAGFTNNTCAYYLAGRGEGLENLAAPGGPNDVAVDSFPTIGDVYINNTINAALAPGWGMSARIEPGSAKEAAAWGLIAWLTGKEAQTWLLDKGYIENPSRNDVLAGELDYSLQPPYPLFRPHPAPYPYLQNLLTHKTIIVDEPFSPAFQDAIRRVIEDLGTGLSAEAAAARLQAAFDADR
jgi:raffinose/stachyose/melibiose transport system substrate-binding protein